MPRPEKVQAVAEIKERLEVAQAVFLTEYRGIAVQQMGDLRRRVRDAGGDYKVVKMSLARRAAEGLGIEGLTDEMVGPTALAFANADPVGVAKALSDYAKENDRLVIKLGLLADRLLRPEEVSKLAALEPRQVLLAKIAGAAKAPLANLAGMLTSFTRDAAGLFAALLDKREAEPGAASESGT
ncbi:MAG: 50S ribosomal protein L10, partial [Acidimicrobiia bacterium]